MIYTTQELITILEQEIRATCQGKRVLLSAAKRLDNVAIAEAINLDKVGNIFAYQDFRQQIHEYQRQNQVSGIVWRDCQFQGQTLTFPEVHHQLITVTGDKDILIKAKDWVIRFWWDQTIEMRFWYSANHYRPINSSSLTEFIEEAEWAELDATQQDLFLGLCWGKPEEYQYQWAKPESGCHRILASKSHPSSIKI